jgi:hypothetical protein
MQPNLIKIASLLRENTLCDHIFVFGSAVVRPDEANDLDVGLILAPGEIKTETVRAFTGALIHIARQFYGSFDPFVLLEKTGKLWVRNDEATGWVMAKNAKKLAADIGHGEPFPAWFERVITPRLKSDLTASTEKGAAALSSGRSSLRP